MSAWPVRSAARQQGAVLLACLVALAVSAWLAAQVHERAQTQRQRQLEAELLFVGEQYRQAILSFHANGPAGVKRWPARLDELTEDRRFPVPRRHLRKLYTDPLAPALAWGEVRDATGLKGVYSQAPGTPLRQSDAPLHRAGFEGAQHYADWKFTAAAPGPSASAPQAPNKTPLPETRP